MRQKSSRAAFAALLACSLTACHLYFEPGDEGAEPTPTTEPTEPGDTPTVPDPEPPECFPEELLGGTHPQCNGFAAADCDGLICAWCSGRCVSEEMSVLPSCDAPELSDSCQPSTCLGEVLCDEAAPECPPLSTPEIVAGCYSGSCIAKADCPDGAPFACSDLNLEEEACAAHTDCAPVYRGVNCTSESGAPCSGAAEGCSCESFAFDRCEPV